MWIGFDSRTLRHVWVEFVAGYRPCSERFFSGYSGFPSPQKPTFPYSNSMWRVSTYCKEHLFISSWNYALYKFTNLIAKKLYPLATGALSTGKPNKILLKKKLERGGLGNRSLKWTRIPSRENYIMARVASYQGNRSIERAM